MRIAGVSIAFFILLFSFPSGLRAQDWEALDAFVQKQAQAFWLPGAALTVVKGDSIVFSRSYGAGITTERPYFIGSLSKPLTATLVLQLVAGGQLGLPDLVAKWLPMIDIEGPGADTLTVQHLLQHRSGLTRSQGFLPLPTLDQLKETPFAIRLTRAPGAETEYSNLNFALLGLIVERAAGRPFADCIRDSLFVPLDMERSFASLKEAQQHDLAQGYQYWFGWPLRSQPMGYAETAVPAGFLLCSTNDLGHFLISQLREGRYRGRQILAPGYIRMQQTPRANIEGNRGLGWAIGAWNARKVLQHDGAVATAYAYMALLPEDSLGFVFLTNVNAFNPIANSVEKLPEGVLNFLTGQTPQETFGFHLLVLAGFGLLLLLTGIDFLLKTIRWWRAGRPLQSGESLRRMLWLVFTKAVFPIALIWGLLTYFGIPFHAMLALQPDMGWAIVGVLFLGFVGGFLDHYTKVHLPSNTTT